MCFILNKKSKLRKARWNKTCYKLLSRCDDDELHAYYARSVYRIGELYNQPTNESDELSDSIMGTIRDPIDGVINVGYHSFRRMPSDACLLLGEVIVKCVIPKGTYYRKNAGEFVSEAIIIKDILHEY